MFIFPYKIVVSVVWRDHSENVVYIVDETFNLKEEAEQFIYKNCELLERTVRAFYRMQKGDGRILYIKKTIIESVPLEVM